MTPVKTAVLVLGAVILVGAGFLAGRWSVGGGYMYKQIPQTDDVSRVNIRTGVKEYASAYGWITTDRLADKEADRVRKWFSSNTHSADLSAAPLPSDAVK